MTLEMNEMRSHLEKVSREKEELKNELFKKQS